MAEEDETPTPTTLRQVDLKSVRCPLLLVTSASLVVTGALLVVTRSY